MAIHSPELLNKHNQKLGALLPFLFERNIPFRTPSAAEMRQHDKDDDDHGFDFMIFDTVIDFKGFGLRFINHSVTWDSTYWENIEIAARRLRRPGLVNDFYLFYRGPDPKNWLAMRRSDTKLSIKGYGPYCWRDELLTLDQLIEQCAN